MRWQLIGRRFVRPRSQRGIMKMKLQIKSVRREEARKVNALRFKNCPLVAASIIVYAGINLAGAEDNPPSDKPAQTKSQLPAPDVQPAFEARAYPPRQVPDFLNAC